MLKKEVVEAVRRKQFHIYGVSTVEEGIEILTGRPAGKADRKGNYPAGTVYAAVQKKLRQYHRNALRLKKELESGYH